MDNLRPLSKTMAIAVDDTASRLFATDCHINRNTFSIQFEDCGDRVVITPRSSNVRESARQATRLFYYRGDRISQVIQNWEIERVEITSSLPRPYLLPEKLNLSKRDCTMHDLTQISSTPITAFGSIDPSLQIRFTTKLLDAMGTVLTSSKPMGITRLSDQKQLFLNQGFLDLLATPPERAIGRNMKLGWNPEHLHNCNQQIKQEGRFQITYESALNPTVYAAATALIELIDDGIDQYRLNTNLGVQVMPFPEAMRQLTQFDW